MTARKKKKRGGQPRNVNALRHGFYSRQFKDGEVTDLDVLISEGLSDEINMLRVITRRVMELADDVEKLDTAVEVLGALGLAATRLAGLLKIQKILGADEGEVTAAISEALTEILKEWKRIP